MGGAEQGLERARRSSTSACGRNEKMPPPSLSTPRCRGRPAAAPAPAAPLLSCRKATSPTSSAVGAAGQRHPDRGRHDAVDAVGAAIGEDRDAVACAGEPLEVAHRHGRRHHQRCRLAGTAGRDRPGDAGFGGFLDGRGGGDDRRLGRGVGCSPGVEPNRRHGGATAPSARRQVAPSRSASRAERPGLDGEQRVDACGRDRARRRRGRRAPAARRASASHCVQHLRRGQRSRGGGRRSATGGARRRAARRRRGRPRAGAAPGSRCADRRSTGHPSRSARASTRSGSSMPDPATITPRSPAHETRTGPRRHGDRAARATAVVGSSWRQIPGGRPPAAPGTAG